MADKVISKESVIRGNTAMINGSKQGVSLDGNNVSVQCQTSFGSHTITFSRETINSEANKAFRKIVG